MNHEEKLEVYRQLSQMPEKGIEWLSSYKHTSSLFTDRSRQVIEYIIYRRGYPNLVIAIAEYGTYTPILRRLYYSDRKSLKLAVLANANVGPGTSIFSRDRYVFNNDDVLNLITNRGTDIDCFSAYFANPHIPRQTVADIIEKQEPYGSLSSHDLLIIIAALSSNPLLGHKRDETFLDGYDEYSFYRLNRALLRLVEDAPNDQQWASILNRIFENLFVNHLPTNFGFEKLGRWVIEEFAETDSEETLSLSRARSSASFILRENLAAIIWQEEYRFQEAPNELPSDAAVRLGIYSTCEPYQLFGREVRAEGFCYPLHREEKHFYADDEVALSIYKKVDELFDLDGNEFIEALIRNSNFWQREAERNFLEDLAWRKASDPHSSMDMPNLYRGFEYRLREKNPEIFDDEPYFDTTKEMPQQKIIESMYQEITALRKELKDAAEDSLGNDQEALEEGISNLMEKHHSSTRRQLLNEIQRLDEDQRDINHQISALQARVMFLILVICGSIATLFLF